ncbi:MAG: hypothetical protein JXR64_06080, partial [Spirochaetales bacterium]|nr:hypothetical protein [Spirochaetales bacterium]
MKQYKRGIEAYKSVSTGVLTSTEPVQKNPPSDGLIKKTVKKNENKIDKIAKLLLVLGKKEASTVISTLPERDIENISRKIAGIDRVPKKEAVEILEEFGKKESDYICKQGGVETARAILVNAFGQEKGNKVLYKAVPDSADKPFSFLNDLDFNQRMMILRKESQAVLTIVLNYLSPKYSSQILESLPPEQQKDIVRRLTKLKRVSPEVINIISTNLKERINKIGLKDNNEIDGRGALVDILKFMDRDDEVTLLSELDKKDPVLGEIIRDRLYTIDVIHNIDKIDLQKVIQELTDTELVYLIKGESEEI